MIAPKLRLSVLALLASTLAGCDIDPYVTPNPVFTTAEALAPPHLATSYRYRATDSDVQFAARLVPLEGNDRVYILEAIPQRSSDNAVQEAIGLIPVRFIPLDQAHYIADLGPVATNTPDRGYIVVGLWPNIAEVHTLAAVPEQTAKNIAFRRGMLSSGKPSKLTGNLTAPALKGLFADLLAALPPNTTGRIWDAAALPTETTASHVKTLTDALLTPDRITTRQAGDYMVRYLQALDRRGEIWGTYGLARQRLAEGNHNEAARLAETARAGGIAHANYVLGVLAQQGENPDHIRAGRLLRDAATAGETRAMLALHAALRIGRGVFRSEAEALSLLRKAAEGNLAAAQVELGRRLLEGDGVEKNETEAAAWFAKASSDAEALTRLAALHATGQGVRRDDVKATELLESAAIAGWTRAEFEYAERVMAGQGATRNPEVGMMWLQRAAAKGYPPAQQALERLKASAPQPCLAGSYKCARLPDGSMLMQVPLGPGWFFKDGREAPAYLWPK